ncbi:MAG: type IV secretion system DNA-binding domain-containing protein [Candidatus Gracilibacteria bacterium]|nr:type IV secretion system DNA-binding domain-containing protein [Candidatus Gracilibacteria bacterium]
MEILFQATIGIAAIIAVISGVRLFIDIQQHRYRQNQKYVLISIRVSKENEKLPIVAEQMFAVLHGIHSHISLLDKLKGIDVESLSFEIANVDGMIKFYAHVPIHLKNLIENQIYAQYADVEITEVKDYMQEEKLEIRTPEISDAEEATTTAVMEMEKKLAQPAGFTQLKEFQNSLAAELTLSGPSIYPIKRYTQFEDKITRTAVDPLSGITSTLMKLPYVGDKAAVQIVIKPIGDEWRKKATECARILGKGIFFHIHKLQKWYTIAFMTRSIWPKIVFFPIYWVFFFQGLMSGSKHSFSVESGGGGGDVLSETMTSSHDRESATDAVMDKVIKLPFDVSIRVLYTSATPDTAAAKMKIRELTGAFKQFNQPHLNSFKIAETNNTTVIQRFREREIYESFVLNVEELATVFHLPNIEVKTPNIFWVSSKKLEPPVDLPDPAREKELTTLGKSNYRGVDKLFGIRNEDRRRHIYIIGKTGMGKSTLLENMIISDIRAGKGVAVVDPHGDLADTILSHIPSNRTNDVIVFDPSDRDFPVAFNMLENIDPAMNSVVASGLVGIFKKLYAESWGPRLEHILRNTILSLLEYPNTTMLGIPRILVDKNFRRQVVKKISDPIVKRFWEDEFEKMQDKQRVEAISPIQNKVGQFLSSAIIRNIVGQPKSMIDLRYAMDNKKIFICNLSKGKIGEDNSSLLGSMIITKFQLDAMSRSNIPEKDRVDFYLYVDEFQNFATDSFATILSEARKYRLNLTMANQYIAQMSEEVQEAVFGNVGTTLSFQVGFDDAEYISKQFSEVVTPNDLVQLPKYSLYSKLLIDGMPSQPFSAATLPPVGNETEEGRREKVIRFSRERYSKPRAMVEDKIKRWSENSEKQEEIAGQKAEKKQLIEKDASVGEKKIFAKLEKVEEKAEETAEKIVAKLEERKPIQPHFPGEAAIPQQPKPTPRPANKSGYQLPKIKPQPSRPPVNTVKQHNISKDKN